MYAICKTNKNENLLQVHDHTNLQHCLLHREIKKLIKGRFRWVLGILLWNHHFLKGPMLLASWVTLGHKFIS